MNDRHAQLLCGLVAEYIRQGNPVSSAYLTQSLGLLVSSATVRSILRDLEEEGYIHQPHTSAGRVPTDKGYRYYVNSLVARDINKRQKEQVVQRYQELKEEYGKPSRASAKLLSEMAHALAVTGWMRARDIHEAGLAEVLNQGTDEGSQAIREISVLLENVDRYLAQAVQNDESNTTVYIGSENPMFDAMHTSSLIRIITLPNNEQVVLLLIGPKRMSYQKNVSLLESVASIISEEY